MANNNSQNLKAFLDGQLQCSICNEVYVSPMVTDCGHTFCEDCIEDWKEQKKPNPSCPLCRANIITTSSVQVLDGFIEEFIDHFFPEGDKSSRNKLINERKKKKEARQNNRKQQPDVIQALGLSSGGGQSGSNPMAGLNIGALPTNPALVAAALGQAAGWSLMGNLQQSGPGNAPTGAEHGPPFPTPTSFSTPGNVTTSQVSQVGHTTMTSAQPAAAAGNNAGISMGWGPSAGAPSEAIPAQTPPAVTPQHHPGSWPSQTRDKHGNSWKYSDMP